MSKSFKNSPVLSFLSSAPSPSAFEAEHFQDVVEENDVQNVRTTQSGDVQNVRTTQSGDVQNVRTTQSGDVQNVRTTQSGDVQNVRTTQSGDVQNVRTTQSGDVQNVRTTQSGDVQNVRTTQSGDVQNVRTNNIEFIKSTKEVKSARMDLRVKPSTKMRMSEFVKKHSKSVNSVNELAEFIFDNFLNQNE